MAEPSSSETSPAARERSRSETARLAAVTILAIVATLFAVFNLDEVEVNLLLGTTQLPLILVIVACLAIGAAFGALMGRRGRRRTRRTD
ncbi:MAG: LapA family protein [Conexibacter sp.]